MIFNTERGTEGQHCYQNVLHSLQDAVNITDNLVLCSKQPIIAKTAGECQCAFLHCRYNFAEQNVEKSDVRLIVNVS